MRFAPRTTALLREIPSRLPVREARAASNATRLRIFSDLVPRTPLRSLSREPIATLFKLMSLFWCQLNVFLFEAIPQLFCKLDSLLWCEACNVDQLRHLSISLRERSFGTIYKKSFSFHLPGQLVRWFRSFLLTFFSPPLTLNTL